MLPVGDEPREVSQRRGALGVEPVELRLGHGEEVGGVLAGLVDAEQLRVSGLVGLDVLPGRLPELLRCARHVEHVVDHLEEEPDAARVPPDPLHLGVRAPADDGAGHGGGLEEPRRLVHVDVLQHGEADGEALALLVGDLPGGDPPVPRRSELGDRPGVRSAGRRGRRSRAPRARTRGRGARRRRGGGELAEGDVVGGAAPAEGVVVHARHVVVDERHGVDHLDRAGDGRGRRGVPADELARGQREHRAPACRRRGRSSAWTRRAAPGSRAAWPGPARRSRRRPWQTDTAESRSYHRRRRRRRPRRSAPA